ncbi:hypothetical protein ACFLYO_04675 [Chloroflexota bacterium]
MTTFKKILAILVIGIAALGILLMAAGIIGAWRVNTQVTEVAVELATISEEVVTVGHDAATRVNTGLDTAQGIIVAVDEQATQLGEDVSANTVIIDLIEELLDVDLKGALVNINDTLNTVKDITASLADTVDAMNRLPFVAVEGLSSDRSIMREISDGIEALQTDVGAALVQTQERKEEIVGGAVEVVTDATTELSTEISTIQAKLDELIAELSALQSSLASLRENLPLIIDLICIALTLIFLFIALAFESLIMHAWAIYVKPDHTFRSLVPLAD